MTVSINDIRNWLHKGQRIGATHLILVVDDPTVRVQQPVYVTKEEDVKQKEAELKAKEKKLIDEVYSYRLDLESQLAERRALHYE